MFIWLFALACDEPPPPVQAPVVKRAALDTARAANADAEETPRDQQNRKPRLRDLKILPENLNSTTDARVKFTAKDPDDDPIDIDIQWYVNDRRVGGGTHRTLGHGAYRRGDALTVEVNVSDGRKEVEVTSDPLEVLNTPPEIILPRSAVNKLDGYKVQTKDADDDTLTFSVEEAPPGLSIDRRGIIHYTPSSEVTEGGEFATRVIVSDGSDDFAYWEIGIRLNAARAPSRQPSGQPKTP